MTCVGGHSKNSRINSLESDYDKYVWSSGSDLNICCWGVSNYQLIHKINENRRIDKLFYCRGFLWASSMGKVTIFTRKLSHSKTFNSVSANGHADKISGF